jgi:phosphoribosyl 1,2-cyclic phosphodiesterase
MQFSCLSSGSKANCTYVKSAQSAVLVDVGLSARQVELRLESIGAKPQDISAILITHEHSDHICGVESFSRKHRIPVYANQGAAPFVKKSYHVEVFASDQEFVLDDFHVQPVTTQHDAAEPVGFILDDRQFRIGVITDLGRITPTIRHYTQHLNAIILESNHDQELLQICSYAWHLKQRISSTHGHLSNDSAAAFLATIATSQLSHIVLAHLSENSNTPRHALNTAAAHLTDWAGRICCASVAQPTPLVNLRIENNHAQAPQPHPDNFNLTLESAA